MTRLLLSSLLAFSALATGCATSQNVTVGQLAPARSISTAALVPQDGNSAAMDNNVRGALMAQGVTAQGNLPAGTRKSSNVDAIVSYTDVWRWDVAMYLRSMTINVFDATSGNLLAMGRWDNSAFHGFQDAGQVTKDLMTEVFSKIKASKAP
ncbi:MAG: hypothetical protein C0428_14005 [Polaromonas sp.]|nr:hypothetical protein [Polaromonas sp.]